jgi:hypothetical protein
MKLRIFGLSILCTIIFMSLITGTLLAQHHSKADQIKAAVQPLPQDMQAEATVKGYNEEGELVTLKEGTNKMICLADEPGDDRYHVACYHESLEPFMARGRELVKEGKSRGEKQEIREREIKNGSLKFPDGPAALYNLTGPKDGFDYERGELRYAKALRVVYIPYATVASTGLSPHPIGAGAPWLMNPSMPWAHIMISGAQPMGYDAQRDME